MKNFLRIIVALLSTIGIIAVIIIAWEIIKKSSIPLINNTSTNLPGEVTPQPPPTPPTSSDLPLELTLEQRLSEGDRRLFQNLQNVNADQGIEAFKSGNYQQAKQFFEQGIKEAPNDPEVQIYLNNTEAKIAGNPLAIATVIPVDTNRTNAEEMLRGVADAQTQFNQKGLNGRLLEVIIANDSNEPQKAQEIAQNLVNNPRILGIIGHNSSSASEAGLTEYQKVGLAMISPTSTSTQLFSNVFFRTVPSDAKAGETLARYALDNNINNVALFYTSKSSYSKSLKDAFINYFEQLGKVNAFDISVTDFNPQTTVKALENKVEAIILFPDTNSANIALKIAKENQQLSSPIKLIGGDSLYKPATLTIGDDSVKGLVLAVPWFAKNSYQYANTAATRWGGRVSWRTAMSYDATQALIKALSPEATRNSVLTNLRKTNLSNQETSGEQLQFLSNGDRTTNPILVQVVEGGKNRPEGSNYSFEILNSLRERE